MSTLFFVLPYRHTDRIYDANLNDLVKVRGPGPLEAALSVCCPQGSARYVWAKVWNGQRVWTYNGLGELISEKPTRCWSGR